MTAQADKSGLCDQLRPAVTNLCLDQIDPGKGKRCKRLISNVVGSNPVALAQYLPLRWC